MDSNTLELEWKKLEAFLAERFDKVPNTEAMLYLVGLNEYKGRIPKIKFSKEQKQELMHVGLCTLLSIEGYYRLSFYDDEGWPHFETLKKVDENNYEGQDALVKRLLIQYFDLP